VDSWPGWTDRDCWEPGPELEPAGFEPSPEDEEWAAGLPSDEDLEAMARAAAWQDHLEGLARMPHDNGVTDSDIITTQGGCG
jgi:hypothetical protein